MPHHNTSVEGLSAEWIDGSFEFSTLKVMWLEVAVQGALATYMVTYDIVPVGNTVGFMNTSNSTERTVTAKNNGIVITGLNPKEFYFLHVEVVLPVNGIDKVAIGKCMHICGAGRH